jgi:hypothetical protein
MAGCKRVNLFVLWEVLVMEIARKKIRYETIEPFLSVFADGAAFSFFRWNTVMWTGRTDIAGASFIRTED